MRNMLQDEKTRDFTPEGVVTWLCDYVNTGGSQCVKAKGETDEYWLEVHPDDPWWYKVNIPLVDRPQKLFVKMKLVDPDDEEDPWTEIIGCHF